MGCPAECKLEENLVFSICTHDPDTGVLTDADADPAWRVYEDESVAAIDNGTMSTLDAGNTDGFYTELIAVTAAAGYEVGKTYTIYITATVDSDTGGISFAFKVVAAVEPANLTQIGGDSVAGNAATLTLKQLDIQNSGGHGVIMKSTGGNGHGLEATGNGTGSGIQTMGGATGHGVKTLGGATSGSGILAEAQTEGDGIDAVGKGTLEHGIRAYGGDVAGDGIHAEAPTNGDGIQAAAAGNGHGFYTAGSGSGSGIETMGGPTGHGLEALGGNTSGDGIYAKAQTNGHGIESLGASNKHGILAQGDGSGEGLSAFGGATGHGIAAMGGATSGDGLHAEAQTEGDGLEGVGAGAGLDINGIDVALGIYDSPTKAEMDAAHALLATAANLTTVDTVVDAIKAKTDNLPSGVPKNVALSNFMFLMTDSTNHDPATGLAITGTISKDGAAFAALTNAEAEVANGMYKVDLEQAEMNADVITLRFTAPGADDRFITIFTG
jgi:hypothetical protein